MNGWPFADPPNVAVFTSRRILSGQVSICFVTHDEEDGAWQFHPRDGAANEGDAAVAGLQTIFELDPSVGSLADLPLGWSAWRDEGSSIWQRMPSDLQT
jgi:hypothetical protein